MSKRPPRQQGYPWLIPYLTVKNELIAGQSLTRRRKDAKGDKK